MSSCDAESEMAGGKRKRRGVHMPPGWREEKAKIAELLEPGPETPTPPPPPPPPPAALASSVRGKPAIFHEQQQFAVTPDSGEVDDGETCVDNVESTNEDGPSSPPPVYQMEFEKFLKYAKTAPKLRPLATYGKSRKLSAASTSDKCSKDASNLNSSDPLNVYISDLAQESRSISAPVVEEKEDVTEEVEECKESTSSENALKLLSDQLEPKVLASLDALHHEPPFEIIEQTVNKHVNNDLLQAVTAAMCAQNKTHSSLALTRFKKAVGALVGEEAIEKAESKFAHRIPADKACDSVEDTLKSCGLAEEVEDLKKVYPNLEPIEKRGKYTIRMTLFGHTSAITTVKFSPKGHYILSGGNDGILKVWAVMRGVRRKALIPFKKNGTKLGISDAAFSSDQMRVLVVSDDVDPKIIHWPKSRVDKILNAGHTSPPVCCMFSPDSKYAVTGGYDGRLILWDCGTSMKHVFQHPSPVLSVDFNPVNPGLFVTGCADGVVRLWDVHRRTSPVAHWMCEGSMVGASSVRFLPRGNLMLVSSEDGHVRLACVSAGSGGASHTLRDYTGHTNSRARLQSHYDLSSGQAKVISGSEDGSLYVWDMASARLVDTLSGHADTVATMDVHPTASMLCSGGYARDMSVKVWQMLT